MTVDSDRVVNLGMDADRTLLFAVLALQTDLLDADQFIEACTLWTARKETELGEVGVGK